MDKIKCITFDKNAQDSLPQHIKDKMKADRDFSRNNKKSYLDQFNSELTEKIYKQVLSEFKKGDEITTTQIQVKCKCGYHSANRVLEALISENKVTPTKYEWVFLYNYA